MEYPARRKNETGTWIRVEWYLNDEFIIPTISDGTQDWKVPGNILVVERWTDHRALQRWHTAATQMGIHRTAEVGRIANVTLTKKKYLPVQTGRYLYYQRKIMNEPKKL